MTSLRMVLLVLAMACLWQWLLYQVSHPPDPTDPHVQILSDRFQQEMKTNASLSIRHRGILKWDHETFLWNNFAEKFGSNPNTPYMYSVLPKLLGFIPLPSPMWRLRHDEAVVLIAKKPPPVEYFSFTTFCLWTRKRGFVFASLADSVNSQSLQPDHDNNGGAFAHVVVTESSRGTLERVQQALVDSGLAPHAIHVAVVPNELIDEDSMAVFEVVLRLFRFHNQTLGEEYLHSNHPVFHIRQSTTSRTKPDSEAILPLAKPTYKDRTHVDSVHEPSLWRHDFAAYQEKLVANIADKFDINFAKVTQSKRNWVERIPFGPLYIRGLHCVRNYTHCLGDCPDAAYFGTYIRDNTDVIPALQLTHNDELHLMTLVDHRQTKAATYSSVALLTSPSAVINKTRMEIYGTSLGVLSNVEFHNHPPPPAQQAPFFSWIFTRNPDHCTTMSQLVHGCTVMDDAEVPRNAYFAYCERLYLNTVTGTGPDWNNIAPGQLYHLQNLNQPKENPEAQADYNRENAALFSQLRLPASNVPFKVFHGEAPLRFLHIIKTGGESFEGYLGSSPDLVPQIDYPTCRRASMANLTAARSNIASPSCWGLTTAISTILCSLNCECCAADMYQEGRFHGTILRSPRAHTLSLFSHGHNAHHTTWKRMAADKTNYLAEGVLRGAEFVCGHSGTGGVKDWKAALETNLRASLSLWPLNDTAQWDKGVQVISLRNTQSHAMTCGKTTKGSLGQHFRVLPQQSADKAVTTAVDLLEPNVEEALETVYRMEWIGLTDLFHESLCLLHYQANQTLPATCDCHSEHHHVRDKTSKPLGHWVEYRNRRRSTADISPRILKLLDDHTTVDAKLFSAALRLVLGRLRRVEEITGASLLECIDWLKLKTKTDYIPGLWTGGPDSLLHSHG